jgi:small subunit ribosomal protein S16
MVKIRLARHGRKRRPFYRVVAADINAPRDGKFLEILGTYNPVEKEESKELTLKIDRVDYWLSVGAQPTDTAAALIKKFKAQAE